MAKIILLMGLFHIIDDFVLQPVCLSQLKCKSWWIEECKKNNVDFKQYEGDYISALLMHAFSWSIMILVPVMFMMDVNDWLLIKFFIINAGIHAYVDDLKANRFKINLWTDQLIHIIQILITFYIIVFNPTLLG
jgi:hypothetical protein